MTAVPYRLPALVRFFFWMGVMSTLFYALCVTAFTIYPHIFAPWFLLWVAEWWGHFGAVYIVFQILPIVTRPVHKDAWEITDHLTSHIPAAILLFGFTFVWWTRGESPGYAAWKIWSNSLFISLADVFLTLVSLKISRYAARITPA